jgi:hypothetical protein
MTTLDKSSTQMKPFRGVSNPGLPAQRPMQRQDREMKASSKEFERLDYQEL